MHRTGLGGSAMKHAARLHACFLAKKIRTSAQGKVREDVARQVLYRSANVVTRFLICKPNRLTSTWTSSRK